MLPPTAAITCQFGITMAIAIALSGLVALTLTPALCALLLRPHDAGYSSSGSSKPSRLGGLGRLGDRFFGRFNTGYGCFERGFTRLFRITATKWILPWAMVLGFAAAAVVVAMKVPSGFIPNEDQGMFYVSITSPPGATLERTKETVDAIVAAGQGLGGVDSIASLAGTNILSDGTGAAYGTCLVNLKPWGERTQSVEQVIAALRAASRTSRVRTSSSSRRRPSPATATPAASSCASSTRAGAATPSRWRAW